MGERNFAAGEKAAKEEIEDLTDQVEEIIEVEGEEYPPYTDKEDTGVRRKEGVVREKDDRIRAAEYLHREVSTEQISTSSERHPNQDKALNIENIGLIGAFDGVGSDAGGDVASSLAADTVAMHFLKLEKGDFKDPDNLKNELVAALGQANKAILSDAGRNTERGKMKSTAVVGTFTEDEKHFAFAGIGDSHVYLIRDGKLEKLLDEDNLLYEMANLKWIKRKDVYDAKGRILDKTIGECGGLQEFFKRQPAAIEHLKGSLIKSQGLSGEEAKNFDLNKQKLEKLGALMTQALGNPVQEGKFMAKAGHIETKPGDVYMLASDGIDVLTEEELVDLYSKGGVKDVVDEIKRRVKEEGAHDDDITITTARVGDEADNALAELGKLAKEEDTPIDIDLSEVEAPEELDTDELIEVVEKSPLIKNYKELAGKIEEAKKLSAKNREIVLNSLLKERKNIVDSMSDEEIIGLGLEEERLTQIYLAISKNQDSAESIKLRERARKIVDSLSKEKRTQLVSKIANRNEIVSLGLVPERLDYVSKARKNLEENPDPRYIQRYNLLTEETIHYLRLQHEASEDQAEKSDLVSKISRLRAQLKELPKDKGLDLDRAA